MSNEAADQSGADRTALEPLVNDGNAPSSDTVKCQTLLDNTNWLDSPLGPLKKWHPSLRSAIELALPADVQIIIFWGPDFIALYNDAYSATIGNKHPQAFGRPAIENWKELWNDLEPLLSHVLKTGKTFSAQNRPFYIERYGYPETVHFDLSYSAIGNSESGTLGVLCIVNETTQRVVAQRLLAENQERLELLFSQTDAGIALSAKSGNLIKVNQRLCEITGYSESELLTNYLQIIPVSEDRSEIDGFLQRLFTHEESFVQIQRMIHKKGYILPISLSVSPVRDGEGAVTQAIWTILDITEQQRAQALESQLAAIVASSHDAILSTDLDMNILSWNDGAEQLYGYRAEEIVGQKVTVLLPSDRAEEESDILKKISQGLRVAPHETVRLHKNGGHLDVQLTVSPVLDGLGKIIGASKTAHDISDKKKAEHLQKAILGEMKHRIKNVLATVQALARQTFREESQQSGYEAFEARLSAMARTHDILTADGWQSAELTRIVEQSLLPFGPENFVIKGPLIIVSSRAAVAFSLGLHELATNAAKYGALSISNGKVEVNWSINAPQSEMFEFHWIEKGGPPVTSPQRRGFGSKLIEIVLASEVNGTVAIHYDIQGCSCHLIAPLSGIAPDDL